MGQKTCRLSFKFRNFSSFKNVELIKLAEIIKLVSGMTLMIFMKIMSIMTISLYIQNPDCIWTFVQYLVIIFCKKAIFSLKQLKVTKWFASHNKSGTACMAML